MLRIHCLLTIALAITLLPGCKKKEGPTTLPSQTVSDYLKLTPGNYWVYETYRLDSNYNGGPGGPWGGSVVYDSVYMLPDTSINGRVYHRLSKPDVVGGSGREMLISDSLDYAIMPGNRVLFALSDTTSIFTSFTYQQGVVSDDSAVTLQYKSIGTRSKTTPAGTFNAVTMATTWTFYPYASQARSVRKRAIYSYYAAGMGLVAETMPFYAGQDYYIERRLIRYHVQ